jgi:hypothetical protein
VIDEEPRISAESRRLAAPQDCTGATGTEASASSSAAWTAQAGAAKTALMVPLPYARIELLIRTMLAETWAPEAWPVVKHEFVKAMKLRSYIARAGWWN